MPTQVAAVTNRRPRSLAAFIRLCLEHGDMVISGDDAIEAGLPAHLVERFSSRYLDRRWHVPLADLIPFIQQGHFHWGEVILTIVKALKREGALDPNFKVPWARIQCPQRRRIKVDLS